MNTDWYGGYTIGLTDYSAMLVVNDPYVVLSAVDIKLLVPVKIGDKLLATAEVIKIEGKKEKL
jgi:acyl-coenzyme A thioesterase PaaI-like protein